MDTSEKYIKMCEKALRDLWIKDYKWRIGTLVYNEKTKSIIPIAWEGTWENLDSRRLIPLYRQDQLQEIIQVGPIPSYIEMLREFCHDYLYLKPKDYRNWSWEQLWLAFVMFHKFSKRWDNEKEEWI